jgi:hypothetical protein
MGAARGDKQNVSGDAARAKMLACGNQELAARVSRQKARAKPVAPGACQGGYYGVGTKCVPNRDGSGSEVPMTCKGPK